MISDQLTRQPDGQGRQVPALWAPPETAEPSRGVQVARWTACSGLNGCAPAFLALDSGGLGGATPEAPDIASRSARTLRSLRADGGWLAREAVSSPIHSSGTPRDPPALQPCLLSRLRVASHPPRHPQRLPVWGWHWQPSASGGSRSHPSTRGWRSPFHPTAMGPGPFLGSPQPTEPSALLPQHPPDLIQPSAASLRDAAAGSELT